MLRWQTQRSCQIETLGATAASSRGTTITAAASINTKGSWTDIGAVTSFDYHVLAISGTNYNASSGEFALDIGLGGGANKYALASNLRFSCLENSAAVNGQWIQLPLYVAQGSQLSARVQSDGASQNLSICLHGMSNGWMGAPGGSRLIACYTLNGSSGTDLDPTVANTDTSWTQMTASTTGEIVGLLIQVSSASPLGVNNRHYLLDIGLGTGGNEFPIISDIHLGKDNSTDQVSPHTIGPFPASIPEASRLAARVRTNDVTVTERTINVALFGITP